MSYRVYYRELCILIYYILYNTLRILFLILFSFNFKHIVKSFPIQNTTVPHSKHNSTQQFPIQNTTVPHSKHNSFQRCCVLNGEVTITFLNNSIICANQSLFAFFYLLVTCWGQKKPSHKKVHRLRYIRF